MLLRTYLPTWAHKGSIAALEDQKLKQLPDESLGGDHALRSLQLG